MFWESYVELCSKIGKKPNAVAKSIGVSNATCTKWKSGSIPNGETLIKLADFFSCSVDKVLGRTASPETATPTLAEKEQQLLAAYKARPELQFAVDKLLGIDEETETVVIAASSKNDDPITIEKVPKSKVKKAVKDKSVQSDDDL
ncbi:MAG: helix-turn-helix domain-containing protein [Oscillospiraceae bacterium]